MSEPATTPSLVTRATLRQLTPRRGPQRLQAVRVVRPTPPPGAIPARTPTGRLLYTVDRPLPPPRPTPRPAPLQRRREVG